MGDTFGGPDTIGGPLAPVFIGTQEATSSAAERTCSFRVAGQTGIMCHAIDGFTDESTDEAIHVMTRAGRGITAEPIAAGLIEDATRPSDATIAAMTAATTVATIATRRDARFAVAMHRDARFAVAMRRDARPGVATPPEGMTEGPPPLSELE